MKKEQSTKNNTKPSSNKDRYADLPTLRKSKTDYGKLSVEALRRHKPLE